MKPEPRYHTHVFYDAAERARAEHLRSRLMDSKGKGRFASLVFVGKLRDRRVGPFPKPQFELHFHKESLDAVVQELKASGLTALVHPLTDDDLADHTTLALWIGEPLPLDHSVFDPPGTNKGFARFGKSDF